MIDFEHSWQELESCEIPEMNWEGTSPALEKASACVLCDLRKRLGYKVLYALGIPLAIVAAYPIIGYNPDAYILLGIYHGFSLILFLYLFLSWLSLGKKLDFGSDLLHNLKDYRKEIRGALRFEMSFGAIFVFLSPALGFLFRGVVYSHRTLLEMLSDVHLLLFIGATTAVLGSLALWAAHRMNQASFGKYLHRLDEYIRELSGE